MTAVSAEETAPASRPDPASRRSSWWRTSAWVEAGAAAVISSVFFVLGFGGGRGRLSVPLGGGDLLPAYAQGGMWAQGAPFGNSSLGYPFGMEMRYYPTGDLLQNMTAGLFGWITGNPFLGMNLVFALSFPATAVAMVWVLRVAGLRGPFVVLAAVATTVIPYHWYRLDHIYLGTMYSAVLAVGLALLVGNGTVERRLRERPRRGFVLQLAAIVVLVGISGIYYAFFAILLCGAGLLYRAAKGARWRSLLLAAVPAVGVAVALGAILAPATLFGMQNPPLDAVADRHPVESVLYSGTFVFTLVPAPISMLPGMGPINAQVQEAFDLAFGAPASGVLWFANFGSLATVTALLVVVFGSFLLVRRMSAPGQATGPELPAGQQPTSLGLVGLLGVTTLLFFVPWGLNYAFAFLVSPQLRGWDRLVPVLFTILFLAAGLVLQRLRPRVGRPVAWAVLGLAALVLLLDSVLPYRDHFANAAAAGGRYADAGYAYANALNEAVPEDCGVLQLPFIAYPEVPPKVGMGNYEPLWVSLTNPDKSWSFGAMKGTHDDAWQVAVGDDIQESDLEPLAVAGFCAVHVDARGYEDEDAELVTAELADLLGDPVATGLDGQWRAYALPEDATAADRPDGDLAEAPDGVGIFYSPARITPGDGAAAEPGTAGPAWPLTGDDAEWDVTSIDGGADFRSVRGVLAAGDCGVQEVVVELRSEDGTATSSVTVPSGEERDFAIELEDPTRSAELSVSVSGPTCSADDGEPSAALSLVDPRTGD